MAVIGLSLILASFVYLIVRSPPWLSSYFMAWRLPRIESETQSSVPQSEELEDKPQVLSSRVNHKDAIASKSIQEHVPMPLPPETSSDFSTIVTVDDTELEEQTTPKAIAVRPAAPVSSFSLETASSAPKPAVAASTLMPPPPRPMRGPTLATPSTSSLLPSSPSPSRSTYMPARGPGTSTLAPPPTHNTVPAKSRQVVLQPGRSPLDWARISGPSADLRNLPLSTPYLKITRSQLKSMSGRKGSDAWMALNGKVYNIEPYKEYHPGGIGELLRGAGKDGTKLFGEVHPWVNYETMLQACLVGVLVEEHEASSSKMDEMD